MEDKIESLISDMETLKTYAQNRVINDEYIASDVKAGLLARLYEIRDEFRALPVLPDEEPSSQGEKLAVELGLQLNFRNWLFKSYHVSAGDANELPQLTMNYIYYKKDSE